MGLRTEPQCTPFLAKIAFLIGVQVAMGGAHLVDDAADLVLDLTGGLHLTLQEVLIHLQEELGHNGSSSISRCRRKRPWPDRR